MTKNIAILVPTYNSASTLESTLKAILAQKDELDRHVDFLLLSDDGSKDDTIALARATWNHPRVPMIIKTVEKNQGEYKNVNAAFASMPTHIEWLAIMHADNEALPGWIDVFARETKRVSNLVASVCASYHYVCDGVVTSFGDTRGADFVEDIPGTDAAIRSTLYRGCWWHNGCSINRVSAWKAVGGHPQDTAIESVLQLLGFNGTWAETPKKIRIKGDWDTSLRILSSSYTIRYVGAPLMRYMEVSSSVSSGSFAWHGDLIETLQVIRRHQSVLSLLDIIRLHGKSMLTVARRLMVSIVRRDWRRAWFAVTSLPVMSMSLFAAMSTRVFQRGGRLQKIPFLHADQPIVVSTTSGFGTGL